MSKPTIVDGIKFASKKESLEYLKLKELEKQNKISNLKLQPSFILQEGFTRGGKKYRPITYVSDFEYKEGDETVVVEVKSKFTAKDKVYNIKKKMFLQKYTDISFIEVIDGKSSEKM